MGTNEGDAVKDNRPYWKVIVSLAFSLIGTILFIFVGVRALFYFMPFVIGWFLSFIADSWELPKNSFTAAVTGLILIKD